MSMPQARTIKLCHISRSLLFSCIMHIIRYQVKLQDVYGKSLTCHSSCRKSSQHLYHLSYMAFSAGQHQLVVTQARHRPFLIQLLACQTH